MNYKKVLICLLICIPCAIAIFLHYLFQVPPLILIPETSFAFRPYCDKIEYGNSEVNYYCHDSSIVFGYTLCEGYPYPYAGLAVDPPENRYIDMHNYNHIKMTIKSTSSSTARLYLRIFQKSITVPEEPISQRYHGIQIPLTRTLTTHTFNFSELSTPEWWFQNNNITQSQISPVDYSRVIGIDFNNGLTVEHDKPDTLTISDLSFSRNGIFNYLFLLSTGVIYLVSGIVFLTYKKMIHKKHESLQVIAYKKIDLSNTFDIERNKVVEFIATTFHDAQLSVQKVSESTALSAYKVPQVIKDNFNCSFKEYLNKIRIEEAKRLLSTTDRQVTEIVFAVGYNSPPHFNRLFKSATGKTPREYREDCIQTRENIG